MTARVSNIALLSLGCPKNQVDSEILLGQLNGSGLRYVQDARNADVLIINTCSFIQDAIRESVDEIMGGIQWKQDKPGRKLFVMGCLPQRYPNELAKQLPEVDGFFGVGDFRGIVEAMSVAVRWGHLTPHSSKQSPGVRRGRLTPRNGGGRVTAHDFDDPFLRRQLLSPPHTAYLRISDGCSQGCRYCTIPRIRGPHRSRRLEDIIRETEKLASNGVVELIVIGQETTSYGTDLEPQTNLLSLLRNLSGVDGIRWIRLMYTHPPALTDDMIRGLGTVEHLCAYLDFPIEHASDRILRAMGRKTNQDRLRQQIQLLRNTIPNIALRTSLIVGYPGEGESEFRELTDFLDETRFEHLGVFVFSPEDGTPAKDLPDAVSPEEARDRRDQVMMLAEEWAEECNQSRIRSEEVVLVDEVDLTTKTSIARTQFDAPEIDGIVIIDGILDSGRFETVSITGIRGHDLIARKQNTEAA